ncbi:MAG: ABC transporter permease [Acidobacteria bacterium]|nr:ABC transporter permease [Acidobacteriota bacterium]
MRKLFVASLKMLYRDKQTLFYALLFPVIFAVVFGLFDFSRGPKVDIAMVGARTSPVYRALVEGLRPVASFSVKEGRTLASARAALTAGDIDVVLSVPGEPPAGSSPAIGPAVIEVLYNQSNFDTNQFALGAIERIVDRLNLTLSGVRSPPLVVAPNGVKARTIDYYDFLLPGLVAMGVMQFSIIGMAVAIARFREQRILKRILATPLAPSKFLVAQVGARLVLSVVQAALIMAVGMVLFGARVYGSIFWIVALAAVANLIFLNIGVAVAGRAPNPDAAQGIGNVVALPMMFLSGVFFPTETLPAAMRAVVRYLPLTPLIEALRTIANDGLPITAAGSQLALLGVWVLVSFLLANRAFRFARA